jgi:outer membrane protein assembly factor BamB
MAMKVPYKLVLLILLLLLNGCGYFKSKDNSEPPAPLVKFTSSLQLKTVWTANTGAGTDNYFLKLKPTIKNGNLFTTSPKGHVRVFEFADGKSIWKIKLDIPISAGAGVGEDLVVIGSNKGDVIALSEINGTKQWHINVSSEVLATPRIKEGIVIIRTIDGKIYGLNSQTGKRVWIYERPRVPLLSLRGTSSPILTDRFIIAGFDDGKMAVLELKTGKVLWEAQIATPSGRTELDRIVDIDADPILYKDIVYVTSYQGRTVAIDLVRGKLLWEQKSSSYSGLVVDSDYLYISDSNSYIAAMDRFSGKSVWKQEKLKARGITTPVLINDYIVVGDLEGYLHWMKREDGKFVTRHQIDNASIKVAPMVLDDTLVAISSDGKIVALQQVYDQ